MRATRVDALSLREMKNFVARRPVYTVLGTEKYERLTGSPRATGISRWRTLCAIIADRDRWVDWRRGRLSPHLECKDQETGLAILILLAKASISASFSDHRYEKLRSLCGYWSVPRVPRCGAWCPRLGEHRRRFASSLVRQESGRAFQIQEYRRQTGENHFGPSFVRMHDGGPGQGRGRA